MKFKRTIAFVVDGFIVSMISSFIVSAYLFLFDQPYAFQIKFSLDSFPISFLIYLLAFDLFHGGNTIGKKFVNIKLNIDEFSARDSKKHLIKRTIFKMVSIIIFPLASLLFVFNRGFTIHDYFEKIDVIDD